eukprot:TRINITY_DN29582_c0_g1_i1.p1 TRINITY_DN29582_c0_g1~~TRINITY_DN29582_c0_g1_i1.p1  ORF type:complete len:1219 (+),score=247.98 TRINITY_DN29582_c0_g1_i1:111-3659(+)
MPSAISAAGTQASAQRLHSLRDLQKQGVRGLDEAVAALEAETAEHTRGVSEALWSARSGRLRGRTPAVRPPPRTGACSIRTAVTVSVVMATAALLFYLPARAALSAVGPADAAPPPRAHEDGLDPRPDTEPPSPPDCSDVSEGALANLSTAEQVCGVGAAARTFGSGFTLLVLAHGGVGLQRTLGSWADTGLLSHAELREVIVHRTGCDCAVRNDVERAFRAHAPADLSIRVQCATRKRPPAQVTMGLVAAARTGLVMLVDADRPTLRSYRESQAVARDRVAGTVTAALATAAAEATPVVHLHRASLSYDDDVTYAKWLAERYRNPSLSLPVPAELLRPAGDGAADLSKCRRWCVDFAVGHSSGKTALAEGMKRQHLELSALCRSLTASSLSAAANTSLHSGPIQCGPQHEGFAAADDCRCLYYVCKEWAYWQEPEPVETSRQYHLPLCAATWLRSTDAAPGWWRKRTLVSFGWSSAYSASPSILCVRSKSPNWLLTPAVLNADWWMRVVAKEMCRSSRARGASGLGYLPGRRVWSQHSDAMASFLGDQLQRGESAGQAVCYADAVMDWQSDPEDTHNANVIEFPREDDMFAFAVQSNGGKVAAGADGISRLGQVDRARFPKGTQVEVVGGRMGSMHGKRGSVTGVQDDRIVVFFPSLGASRAVLPLNLRPSGQPTRIRLGCSTSDLSLPEGAVASGKGCKWSDGVVARGASCAVSLSYHTCSGMGCEAGRWNTTTSVCIRTHCAPPELRLAAGIRLAAECGGASGAHGGAVCPVSGPLHDCGAVRCTSGGVWNSTSPVCTRCADLADTNFPGANIPPDNWKTDSACACKSHCLSIGALAFSWVDPDTYSGGKRQFRQCHCKDLLPAPVPVAGVHSGRTGKRDKNELLAETPVPRAIPVRPELPFRGLITPQPAPSAGPCVSAEAAGLAAWGDDVEHVQRAVSQLQLRSASAIRGCAGMMRGCRAAWKRAMPWAAHVALNALDPKVSDKRTPLCHEMPPNVGRVTSPQMAAYRGAQDPMLTKSTRKVVVAVGGYFGRKIEGSWYPGPLPQFVCGYPHGPDYAAVAFDPDPGAADDERYPPTVTRVHGRAGVRDGDGVKDLARWLSANAKSSDFVVLVLDSEPAEQRDLVTHLSATGALTLVDEVLLSCGDRADPNRSPDCATVYAGLREYYVPVHDWPPPPE